MHLRVTLSDRHALARVAAALHARAVPVEHLYVDGSQACILSPSDRLEAVLGRLVDVQIVAEIQCLHPERRVVVGRQPSARQTTPHAWAV